MNIVHEYRGKHSRICDSVHCMHANSRIVLSGAYGLGSAQPSSAQMSREYEDNDIPMCAANCTASTAQAEHASSDQDADIVTVAHECMELAVQSTGHSS